MSSKSENLKPDAISHSWEQLKIGKFAKTVAGGTPSTTNPSYWNGDIRWMNSGELNHKMVYEVENRITELGLRNSSTSLLPLDCVLIGLAGQGKTRGTVAINKVQLCTNQSIAAILPNDKTLPLYLYYNLDSRYEELRRLSTGDGGRGGLNLSIINGIKIPIPPKEEQKAIADCLSTWDEAIEKQTKLIAAKEQRKKALMQQLLSGKKRLPGFENTEVCYDKYSNLLSNVKRKEKWDDNKLYQLISVRRRSGGVFAREELFGNQIAVKELMKVKENDFLISKMQIVHGASAIVPKDFENFYVSGSYIVLNVKDENRLRPLFLKWYSTLRSFYHQTFIASYGVHIEKMTFSFQDFLKEKMRLPNVKEQDLIIEILEQSEKEVKLEKTRLLLLLNQKKAIMQQLLIGKVRLVS